MTEDQFQQIKVDVAFAPVSTDIRMRKGKKLPVERLPKDWDVKRKERLKKANQGTYVISKRKTGTSGQSVGSTPTAILPPKGAPGSISLVRSTPAKRWAQQGPNPDKLGKSSTADK